MRQFYKFLYAEGIRTDDPTSIIDAPRKADLSPKTMSEQDVGRLLTLAAEEAKAETPDAFNACVCLPFWSFSTRRACV